MRKAEPSSSTDRPVDYGDSHITIFLQPPTPRRQLRCVVVDEKMPLCTFWDEVVLPCLRAWGVRPTNLRLLCRGRRLEIGLQTLQDARVTSLTTLNVTGSLPAQGFSRLHQLMEHLLETLAPPATSTGSGNTQPAAADDASLVLTSREPLMHAIDLEISESKQLNVSPAGKALPCSCLSCTGRPNSTLWLCGALLHSTDAAVVNIAFRVVQLLLHSRPDCPEPPIHFSEQAGALTLTGDERRFGWLYKVVHEALTPEGVAIASLLSQRQAYDAKTHPLLWQHPTKKQTLLELAARSHWPGLLQSLLPALNLSRLAGSGALSAVSMAAYKALMSMALNGRHELLSLLLQTGITSAQHALLLLESVIQKKGKVAIIERVVAEMLQYIGPATKEASGVLKVAAGHSCAAVVAMLLDWSHCEKGQLDLQLVGLALAEACDSNNDEVMQLLLRIWKGKCSAMQAQPLLRAFSARGDAATVARLLAMGPFAMVQMDAQQRARLASTGLAHAAGESRQRANVLSTLLQAGADPRGQHGEIALRNAARDGQPESMQLLLQEGTDVNAVDDDGKTVLCVAACSGCCESVRCLLEHGAHVRMRCHDGREPLDFAVDEAVRQLLLAEVEKLRMGLLDELLADEEPEGGKGGKGKKGKKGKKGIEVDAKKAVRDVKAGLTESFAPEKASAIGDLGCLDMPEPQVQSKSAKKKQKKAASKAGVRSADEAGPVDEPSFGGGKAGRADVGEAEVEECSNHKSQKKRATKNASGAQRGEGADVVKGAPPLVEAAVQLLRGQAEGPSMRISSLVSALYDLSTTFKEEIRNAGGAKLWLNDHSDEFVVETDCSPGQECVTLRTHADVSQPPDGRRAQCLSNVTAGQTPLSSSGDSNRSTDIALASGDSAQEGNINELSGRACEGNKTGLVSVNTRDGVANGKGDEHIAEHSEGSDDTELPMPRCHPRGHSPHALAFTDFHDHSFFSWSANDRAIIDAADDAAAAALLGATMEDNADDPVLIEKKIRAVQKKLRRVQTIEELVSHGSALDNGQQALFASKPRLQSQLHQLLRQWAVLEPVLLEQQEQRMLAIANSECAICLEEYDADRPGIRTSCCGAIFSRV